MGFGVVENRNAEVGSHALASHGGRHVGVHQIHDFAIVPKHVLNVRLLVLRLELVLAFVPHYLWHLLWHPFSSHARRCHISLPLCFLFLCVADTPCVIYRCYQKGPVFVAGFNFGPCVIAFQLQPITKLLTDWTFWYDELLKAFVRGREGDAN